MAELTSGEGLTARPKIALIGGGNIGGVLAEQAAYRELGDIIIFEHKNTRIIHRIVKIGWDTGGWYAHTKGDSNPAEDPFKVRFKDVKGVVVGIIY